MLFKDNVPGEMEIVYYWKLRESVMYITLLRDWLFWVRNTVVTLDNRQIADMSFSFSLFATYAEPMF